MGVWLWVLCGALVLIILFLAGKVYFMRKAAQEIEKRIDEILATDTNILIDISCRDKYMRRLADRLNAQLRVLRRERHRYQQGDIELKETITNISHDLRTPLTAIRGYLDLLKQEEKSESTARYLSMIENRTQVLSQLTEELFRYSVVVSVDDADREPVQLGRVLEESLVSHYGAMKQRGITPQISIPEQQVVRSLDCSALVRIFGNIIGNAMKYSAGDFFVHMDMDGTIIFSNTAPDLTPVMVGRLFDRFYTVETGRNSTGLGLSIAKLLTERMDGTIEAEYHDNMLSIILRFPES